MLLDAFPNTLAIFFVTQAINKIACQPRERSGKSEPIGSFEPDVASVRAINVSPALTLSIAMA